jgi:aromatic ring-cleaving dioxygenase
MTDASEPVQVKGYHAHVYYDAATRPVAERLRETIGRKFAVEYGRFSDEPIGPHPVSQFNIIFKTDEFQHVVPWLMLNREGLDVLVHPLTDSSYDDHSKNALWLGAPVPLRLDILRPTYRTELLPTA